MSESMREMCEIKDKISREIEGMSDEEILIYFRDQRPEWVDSLPRFEMPPSKPTQLYPPLQSPVKTMEGMAEVEERGELHPHAEA